ncbi:MAG: hypothetical protein DRQ55_10595 [Planctomycetota bacterium]|nr:MAG: hypothetical protein DRQ55_10595 [Planctomycetota bacterium]
MGCLLLMAEVLLVTSAQVDLPLSPAEQTAVVNQVISFDLHAHADSAQSITAIDAILSWDPNRLELLGATAGDFPVFVAGFLPDPDGINTDLTDGDALYTALAPPATPATAPPDILVASFQFRVITSACVTLLPSMGVFGRTRVIGTVPGVEITGVLTDAVNVEVPGAWVDLYGGIAGTGGLMPVIVGEGILLPCDPVSLTLTDGPPNSTAYLLVALTAINLPFKGGVIVPDLDTILLALPTDAFGGLFVSGPWPPGIPPGITTYVQCWFQDAGAIHGFSASDAIAGTTP